MMKDKIYYVALRPDGSITGPIDEHFTHVKHCLEVGARRAGLTGEWQEVEDLGYTIRRCHIILLEDA